MESARILGELVQEVRSKHVSVPQFALAIACRKKLTIRHAPPIGDLIWLSEVATAIGDSVSWQENRLCYIPRELSNNETIDITSLEGGLRQSIILAPIAMHIKEFLMLPPTGDLIGKRPIEEYSNVLNQFDLEMESTEKFIRVKKRQTSFSFEQNNNRITLGVASTGVTFVALAAAVNNCCDLYEILNASKDPEVTEVLESFGAKYFQSESCLKLSGSIFNKDTVDVPLDRIAIAELLILSELHGGPRVTGSIIQEIIERNGPEFIRAFESLKEFSAYKKTDLIRLSAGQFPKISTDILPALCTSLWLSRIPFEVADNVFEWRMPMLSRVFRSISPEFLKKIDAGFVFNPSNNALSVSEKVVWESDNIRQTSSGIIALTHPDGMVSSVVESGLGITRAYVKEWFEAVELITKVELNIVNDDDVCVVSRK